ncbi:helix-turn-helix domain-containing protein [Segatella oris]
MSVAEIAYKTGLSPKQFSKFFKEQYGCLPSQYKKNCT